MLQLLEDEVPQTSSYQGFAHGHHQGLPSPDPLLLTPAKFIISSTCGVLPQYFPKFTPMTSTFAMVALRNRADHYIFILSFVLLSFFSSPNLSRRRVGVCHTCTHGVALVRRCRSETCCTRLAENTGHKKSRQKSPSGHHRTTLSGYIFATKPRIDNRKKKLVKQQYVLHKS